MVSRTSAISLREITADTVRTICGLAVHRDQEEFVAPNAISIAQAHYSDYAWIRAVYADDTPVGFVMVKEEPETPEYFLWRFMIDIRYQRHGFGRRALTQVIDRVRTLPNATEFITAVVQEDGGPQPFYEKLGFVLTGEYKHGEARMRLQL